MVDNYRDYRGKNEWWQSVERGCGIKDNIDRSMEKGKDISDDFLKIK